MTCQYDIEECSVETKNCSCLYGQDELKCGESKLNSNISQDFD